MTMHRPHAALILFALAGTAGIGAANQTMIANQSEIAYVGTEMGVEVEGNFGRFEAQINLDPDKPQTGSVSLSVDTASVIFPSTEGQQDPAKPDWFDTAHFPRAEFRSTRMRALGNGRYEIAGTLTIKGHSHEVVFPMALSRSGATT